MKAFYDRVFTTPNRAAALRDAVLAIREQYPASPIYWAPFVLMGKALADLGARPAAFFRPPLYRRAIGASLYRCPPIWWPGPERA
jgi:hypothetical protein